MEEHPTVRFEESSGSGPPPKVVGAPRLLYAYAALFAAAGCAFILAPGPVNRLTALAAGWLPGAGPLPGAERSLWLGLTGSLMAVIAYVSFSLARAPGQRLGWEALVLSKAVSTLLFVAFAAADRNPAFLAAAAVDAAICLHMLRLASAALRGLDDPWRPRCGGPGPPGYEVWFVKLNEPGTRDALWLRYELRRAGDALAGAVWYVFFDAGRQEVSSGCWEVPPGDVALGEDRLVCRLGASELARSGAAAEGPEAGWRLAWDGSPAPAFRFVPEWLFRLGVAGTVYASPVSLARFSGEFVLRGRRSAFEAAPGSVGHLWGSRMGDNWRWLHAVLPDPGSSGETVIEVLSAQARLGGLRTPRLTFAHMWHRGRHYASTGVLRGAANRTWPLAGGWGFRVDFGSISAEGECLPAPAMTAELAYADTDGGTLRCRNTKTGALRLSLAGPGIGGPLRLETGDAAAIETVERPA